MIELLTKLEISITADMQNKFAAFKKLLYAEGANFNLTSIPESDFDLLHLADSLTLAKAWEDKAPGSIIDIGTGAGFPGIPIAIVFPEIAVTLVEANEKKVRFLNQVKRELTLKNIICIHGRAELLGHDQNLRASFDLATARAVADSKLLFELLLPFVKLGGLVVAMKGTMAKEELAMALNAVEILGGKHCKTLQVTLPASNHKRSLVLVQKVAETPERFPRRNSR